MLARMPRKAVYVYATTAAAVAAAAAAATVLLSQPVLVVQSDPLP